MGALLRLAWALEGLAEEVAPLAGGLTCLARAAGLAEGLVRKMHQMPGDTAEKLREAIRERTFVRFNRKFESHNLRGYVLDVGPKFFLLALVSDRIWFDGFEVIRIADVRGLVPDPYAEFAERALELRGQRIPTNPDLDLSGIDQILNTAALAFPLTTIHREHIDPEVCWIGRVVKVEKGKLSLLEIGPDAVWDDKPTTYRTNEITRVTFGGDYEGALYLVGGEP